MASVGSARFDREEALERLAQETFDVLVIGGGITGAGVALDAASRGLKTALVERVDFAYGTSSKSSKMIHGGIRYLQQGDVYLVWQALVEREALLRNAPHLVRVLPFMIPIYTRGGFIPKVFVPFLAWSCGSTISLASSAALDGAGAMSGFQGRRRSLKCRRCQPTEWRTRTCTTTHRQTTRVSL